MVRKIEGPDVEPPTQTYLSRDQDPPSPHTSDFVLGRKVYFMPIFKPVPQNYSLETAAETVSIPLSQLYLDSPCAADTEFSFFKSAMRPL